MDKNDLDIRKEYVRPSIILVELCSSEIICTSDASTEQLDESDFVF